MNAFSIDDLRGFCEIINQNMENDSATIVKWNCALDNHTPIRNYSYGEAIRFVRPSGEVCYNLYNVSDIPFPNSHVFFLMDDGESIVPYFVAAYQKDNGESFAKNITIHPIPTRFDYGNFNFGPRKAYHLKVTEYTPQKI